MRLLPPVFLILAMSSFASGQTYAISKFAGGALSVNISATAASLTALGRSPAR